MKRTLKCTLQNRLGALDRVLGALTYRGLMPEQLVSQLDPETNRLEVTITVVCEEEKMLEKLVKFLNKQVYVLEAKPVPVVATVLPSRLHRFAPATRLTSVSAQRRASHVSHR